VIDRRRLLATAAAQALPLLARGANAQTAIDSAPLLQREIDAAAKLGRVVSIPSGISYVSHLRLSENVRLVGAGRASRLVALGPGPMLAIERAESVAIENIGFDGSGRAPGGEAGLIEASNVADLRIVDCQVEHARGHGLRLERCGGRVERSNFADLFESALFSMDGLGLSVIDNTIRQCGNNGLQIWRSAKGDDGTIVRGNHIARVRADRGGDGPYGNGISVFRAGGVLSQGNVVRGCAFSGIRYNAGSDASISGNSCADLGETAIYVEFSFEGAVIEGNFVDGAAVGISITNFDQGGRVAACSGNVVRNIDRPLPQGAGLSGLGIHAEADTVVSGNAIDHASGAGLSIGFGSGLRNVVASANSVSDCEFGAAISVAPGAGSASLTGNSFARSRRGAVVGMAYDKIVADDLVAQAGRYPQLTITGNVVR
jgi:uncharacterized secreted repeat protein (TIGR03808 family)